MRFYFVFCSLEKIMIFTQGCVSVLGADDEYDFFFLIIIRCSPLRRRRRSFHCSIAELCIYTYLFYYAATCTFIYVRACVVCGIEWRVTRGMGDGHCENCIITTPVGWGGKTISFWDQRFISFFFCNGWWIAYTYPTFGVLNLISF